MLTHCEQKGIWKEAVVANFTIHIPSFTLQDQVNPWDTSIPYSGFEYKSGYGGVLNKHTGPVYLCTETIINSKIRVNGNAGCQKHYKLMTEFSIPKYTQGRRTEHSKCSTWRNIPSPVTMPITTNNMQYHLVRLCTSSGSITESTCQKCKNIYYHTFKFLLCVSILVFNSHCQEGTWAIKLPKSVKPLLEIPKDDLDWDLSATFWLNVC